MEVTLLSDGELIIFGTSNVNKFDCELIRKEPVTLDIQILSSSAGVVLKDAVLPFSVDAFNCGGKAINKDFKKSLKGEEYPTIKLTIQKIYLDIIALNGDEIVKSDILLDIAGVQKSYTIQIENLTIENSILVFRGTDMFKMSDFDVAPPEVLWGMIKVNDEIKINFDFSLEFKEM
jgi:hypothetical protein